MTTVVPPRAVLVKGADPSLVAQLAHRAVSSLLDGRDPATCVEEHGAPGAEELEVARLVDALTTPPFLLDRRVVVVRDAGRLSTGDAERLVGVLADLPDGVGAVFVAGGGTVPAPLVRALTQTGEVLDATVGPSIRDRRAFVAGEVRRAQVRLDPSATEALLAHLGEDLSRVDGVLETLTATFGDGAKIGIDELTPFLGATGSVPMWDLTDAVGEGDAARSLEVLHRMVGPGGRSAPEVIGALQRHYLRMLRLDGAGARTKEAAASLLSMSPFPAGKLLTSTLAMGTSRIRQAVSWIAGADADVKGATALEPVAVLEVLVARIARLHWAAGRGAA